MRVLMSYWLQSFSIFNNSALNITYVNWCILPHAHLFWKHSYKKVRKYVGGGIYLANCILGFIAGYIVIVSINGLNF